MDKRDKTIKALEKAIQCFERYSGDEYGREYNYARVEVEVLEDTVTMLKEDERAIQFQSDRLEELLEAQEPKPPVIKENSYGWKFYYCPSCGKEFYQNNKFSFCEKCGKAVKWE